MLAVFLLFVIIGCDKRSTYPTTQPTGLPTLASLVPSATDLVIGMGAKDRLVAVSTYDVLRADVGKLPKAGNYDTVDWELLASLRPTVMCTAISEDRQPQGFKDRAQSLHVRLIDVKVDRLADIDVAMDRLGAALQVQPLAGNAKSRMHERFDAARRRCAGQATISTLIFVDARATRVSGPNTYMDDLLHIAGGTNAAASLSSYPEIDRETLLNMNPQAIIQLLPNASPQEKQMAADVWKRLPQLAAVASGRVYPIYDEYALLPGWHVTDLAEKFTECLHPSTSSSQPTPTSPARP